MKSAWISGLDLDSSSVNGEFVHLSDAEKLYNSLEEAVEILEGILEDPEVTNVFKCHFDHQDIYELKKTLEIVGGTS